MKALAAVAILAVACTAVGQEHKGQAEPKAGCDDKCMAQFMKENIRTLEYCAAHPHGRIVLHLPTGQGDPWAGRMLTHTYPCDWKPKGGQQ